MNFRKGILFSTSLFLMLYGLVLFPGSGILLAEDSPSFTNRAGQPIMAGDIDRIAQRGEMKGKAEWKEGHRWEPPRKDKHWEKRHDDKRDWKRHKKHKIFWLFVLFSIVVVRILLGTIVFMDLRSSAVEMSGLWIIVVLLGGVLASIAYALFRLMRLQESQ